MPYPVIPAPEKNKVFSIAPARWHRRLSPLQKGKDKMVRNRSTRSRLSPLPKGKPIFRSSLILAFRVTLACEGKNWCTVASWQTQAGYPACEGKTPHINHDNAKLQGLSPPTKGESSHRSYFRMPYPVIPAPEKNKAFSTALVRRHRRLSPLPKGKNKMVR